VSQTHVDRAVTAQDVTPIPPQVSDDGALEQAAADKPWWKVPPLHKAQLKSLALIWVALTTAYVLVGLAIVHLWEPSAAGRADARVSQWFDDRRTDRLNHLAKIGSAFSNTETKIGLLIVLCPLMLWMYRRWHDWAFLTIGLIFEVTVFFTASKIVRRQRPHVEQLDTAPTFSWPSGHIAACVVFYVGLCTVVFWNTRSRVSRAVFATIAVIVPLVVITCRLYLGMHYVSDVVGGVVLGTLTLLIVRHQIIAARGGRPMSDPTP
jgi:membrane-associated phospholipid phosphatase